MLENVQFRELGEVVKVDKVKVVACDGKGTELCFNYSIGLTYSITRIVENSKEF